MTKVFIDGSAGTTGLRIYERLSARKDLELITLSEENRKDPAARREAIHAADAVFLCLPDAAAVEAVELAEGSDTVIIDTSTAHRTAPGWVYGFPELKGYREAIKNAKRIANPGCHASGFIALVKPLVDEGLLSADAALSCFSLTGYSGGGKKMIAEYEAPDRDPLLKGPRQYGLSQQHPPEVLPIMSPRRMGKDLERLRIRRACPDRKRKRTAAGSLTTKRTTADPGRTGVKTPADQSLQQTARTGKTVRKRTRTVRRRANGFPPSTVNRRRQRFPGSMRTMKSVPEN